MAGVAGGLGVPYPGRLLAVCTACGFRADGAGVYVLDCDQGVKVGITRDLDGRLADFSRAWGQAPPAVFRWFPARTYAHARKVERWAHHLLAEHRTVGEWFHCHPVMAADVVAGVFRDAPNLLESPPSRVLVEAREAHERFLARMGREAHTAGRE